MRKFLLVLAALLLCSVGVRAGTYTAATCNRSDVNAVINGPTHIAVAGDIINIPSGTCTWTSGVAVTVPITVIGSGTQNTLPSQHGAGTVSTILVYDFNGASLFTFTLPYSATVARLSTLDIEPQSGTTALSSPISLVGTCTTSGCPQMRVDNIVFGNTIPFTSTNTPVLIAEDGIFGVADHDTMANGSGLLHFIDNENSEWQGVGLYGDNSWASLDTFGTNQQFYVENCLLYTQDEFSDAENAANGGGIGGARATFRFNQLVLNGSGQPSGVHGVHGLDTNGRPQGGRQYEEYGETIQCDATGSTSCGAGIGLRSGSAISFGNTFTTVGSTRWSAPVSIVVYRNTYTNPQFSACGGSAAWDTNDPGSANAGGSNTAYVYYSGTMTASGTLTMTDSSQSWTTNQFATAGEPYSVYDVTQGFWAEIASNTATTITIQGPVHDSWTGFNNGDSYEIIRAVLCADQPGRGFGNLLNSLTPAPASPVGQQLDPIYVWDNTGTFQNGELSEDSSTIRFLANRDYYTGGTTAQTSPTSPFNGTSGIGFGALADRPSTCTVGVAYFATDQGSWNTSGNGFGQGQLSECTPTLNVDLVYTGNYSTSGTAMTAAIGNSSLVSNNCTPGSCAVWGTPATGDFVVGPNQPSLNNLTRVAVNNGGPTYQVGTLNFNSIQFTNAFTYWQLGLSSLGTANNVTWGFGVGPLPVVTSGGIDLARYDDSVGYHVWVQSFKCGDGHQGFHIETSVLTGGGSSNPCIEPGDTFFPGPFLVSVNWNESSNGLGAYGTYSSGGSVTGSSGQLCAYTPAGGTTGGYITLQGTNSLTGATAYAIATPGTPFVSAPTTGTLSLWTGGGGVAASACSGTITLTGATLGGLATLSVHNAATGVLIGTLQIVTGYSTGTTLNSAAINLGNEESFLTADTWYFQNLMMQWSGTVQQDLYTVPTTGTWATTYTPYTYPHPLDTSSTPPPPAPCAACFVENVH